MNKRDLISVTPKYTATMLSAIEEAQREAWRTGSFDPWRFVDELRKRHYDVKRMRKESHT